MATKTVLNFALFIIFNALLLTITRIGAEKTEWPKFIVVDEFEDEGTTEHNYTIHIFDPNTGTSEIITTAEHPIKSLTSNAYSNKVCRFHPATYGITCHQNGADFELDIPRSNYYKHQALGNNLMSLSPFGDHLIFEEVHNGGIWIYNLEIQKARLLLPHQEQFRVLQVDWDNGYLLALPVQAERDIQVWELNGDAGAKLISNFGFIEFENQTSNVTSFTIDPKTLTAYWATETFLAKASYNTKTNPEPQIICNQTFEDLSAQTLRFYEDGIFWQNSDPEDEGLTLPLIYRLDVKSLNVSTKTVLDGGLSETATLKDVFEDVAEATKRTTNPCSKCSHICIPRQGYRYECTCPFEQQRISMTIDGAKTSCKKPLTVWIVARNSSMSSAPKTYLQSYDAMATLSNSMASSELLETGSDLLQLQGYCTSVGTNHHECIKIAEGSAGKVTTWFNGTCIRHQPTANATWTVYCNSEIDPDHIALDRINWYIFFRNRNTGEIRFLDLVTKYDQKIFDSSKYNVKPSQPLQPMRLAVDQVNQVLYWLTTSKLYQLPYEGGYPKTEPEVIFDLDSRGFKDEQLRFINGLLYWVQQRPSLSNAEREQFVVRFNVTSQTQETFVKVSDGFSITSFAVAVPETTSAINNCSGFCSHFCSRRGHSFHCLCPVELPVLQNGQCLSAASEEAKFSENSTVKWVIVAVVSTIFVIGLIGACGLGIYYFCNNRIHREDTAYWNKFVSEHSNCAVESQATAQLHQTTNF